MNTYTTEFFAVCPNNEQRVKYRLQIRTEDVILVEAILARVGSLQRGFHESFADMLLERFGGQQTLWADHHGVEILTERSRDG